MHAENSTGGAGSQRTYGVLTDGRDLIMLCYDAGVNYASWESDNIADLTGTLTHSRFGSACCARVLEA